MPGTRSKGSRRRSGRTAPASRRRHRLGVLWMLPALALALAAVVVPVLAPHRQAPGPPANSLPRDSGAVPADLYLNLTTIPLQTFDAVGAREAWRKAVDLYEHGSRRPDDRLEDIKQKLKLLGATPEQR